MERVGDESRAWSIAFGKVHEGQVALRSVAGGCEGKTSEDFRSPRADPDEITLVGDEWSNASRSRESVVGAAQLGEVNPV